MSVSGPLYHMAQKKVWEESKASGSEYKPPTYDQDGFTHLTANPSLLRTIANHFYKDTQGEWVLLVLDPSKLTGEVKVEPPAPVGDRTQAGLFGGKESQPDTPKCPHLYGPIVHSAVTKEMPIERSQDGTFLGIPGLQQ